MTLSFPNPARFFDQARHAVLFFGHDGLFEIQFALDGAVLGASPAGDPQASETACLTAFDAMRGAIEGVATSVYLRHRRHSNVLTAADF